MNFDSRCEGVPDGVRDDVFNLVGYLLTSAYGLYDEPASYGPRRLMDAARQLLAIVEAAGWSDPFLVELRQGLDRERFGNSDDQALREYLDQACLQYAAQLKERVANSSGKEGMPAHTGS